MSSTAASINICIIGSSFCGALKKAYQSGETDTGPYKLSFFANAGSKFRDIKIIDGQVTNAAHFDPGASNHVDDYSAVVIYGNLFSPPDVLELFSQGRYSAAVRKAMVLNGLERCPPYHLAAALAAHGTPKIFMLPRNHTIEEPLGSGPAWSAAVALISELISPAIYIPVPEQLFSSDGLPREEFYTGSLNLRGEEPDRAKMPLHHHDHLNQAGGQVMLAALLDRLRAG